VISQHLTVLVSGITLYGQGATIHSTNPTDGALWIKSDGVAVYDFTMQQDSTSRQSTPWAGGISIFDDRNGVGHTIQGAIVQGNSSTSSASTGIFLLNVENFTVANNTVSRSWADGIHMTGGAYYGRAINNTVSQTGDDMISVVSYAAGNTPAPAAVNYANWPAVQAGLDRNIYIAGNTLSDQYWGRGISVVGGSDVTIQNNTVSRTPEAAAVYLTRETSYMTFGDHNILVNDNNLSEIETEPPTYEPAGFVNQLTGHGAIEIGTTIYADEYANPTWRQAFTLGGIAITNNTVTHARFAGIRIGVGYSGSQQLAEANGARFTATSLPGSVQNVTIQGNTLSSVGSVGIIEAHSGLDPTTIACANNTLDGTSWTTRCSSAIAGTAASSTVTGASIQCAASGTLTPHTAPKPPGSLNLSPN
jgi:parallel beta-helix repeat protein